MFLVFNSLQSFEKDYYYIGASRNLGCSAKIDESLLSKVYASLNSELGSSQEIFYRVVTHKVLGVEINEATQGKLVKLTWYSQWVLVLRNLRSLKQALLHPKLRKFCVSLS